ncbi:MAG: hypothetical protein ABR587_17860, partial [Candidatus Binatia bacterium]
DQTRVLGVHIVIVGVGEDDRVPGVLTEGALGHEVAEQDRFILGQVISARRIFSTEQRRHQDLTGLEVADPTPHDATAVVENAERVVERRGDGSARLQDDTVDRPAIVVGHATEGLELRFLVDKTDAL